MLFPTLLYKTPGPHRKPGVGSYRYIGCKDASDYEARRAQGWHDSFEEAIAATKAKAVIAAVEQADEAIDDISPPTREEMEEKARELGLPFNARTSDKTLAQRIADAV